MKKWFLFGLFLIIFSSISLALTISPTSTDSGLLNQTINITIDPVKGNATEVKISLPEGLTFVEWTNNTNQTNTQFTYSSSTLIWKNLTIYGFLNSSGWFSFNVNISKNISNRNLSLFMVLFGHLQKKNFM
ncbi:MAG: hypothetical protein B6U78_03025 [Candidatus Aenigmarchaeota archaeon ex4484_224]|nr:MAG: hypothetical protein B6U78_03025 [Candidatus Aenigmarchaeota archaeon ex4484_224]